MEENVRMFAKETVFPSHVNISMLNLYVSMLLAIRKKIIDLFPFRNDPKNPVIYPARKA